jgi:Tol biopolymer transport system component
MPYLGGESICMVDFSRDGQWIAFVTYPEGTLWRSRIDGSERRQLTVPPMAVANPRWSPDGQLIVFWDMSNGDRRKMNFGDPQRIYVVSADGGGPVLLLAGYFSDPTWSPRRSIAYSYFQSPASEVRILDLQTQKSTTVQGSQGMWSPRWSGDGKYLVALAPPYTASKLMLFDFASNTWKELASGTSFGWPCWSRDSKFVYAQDGGSLVRVAISDHKKEQIASLQGLPFTSYYFDRVGSGWFGLTPDDRPLTTRDTGIQEIYAFDLEYK